MKNPKIVLAGHVCIDHNVTEHATSHSWGSPSMYVADYYYRKYDIPSTIITSYGKDFLPFAAHVGLIPARPNQPRTMVYRNIITADLRTWYSENTTYAVPPPLDASAIEALKSADIFIFGTLLANYPVDYVKQTMTYLKSDAVKAFIPQGYLRSVGSDHKVRTRDFTEAADLLPLFDVCTYSDEDHPEIERLSRQWSQLAGNSYLLLTQGSDGATIYSKDVEQHIPTTPVSFEDIVNSVGCGDVFTGSVALEYYRTRDITEAVKLAHRAAREKLTTPAADQAAQ